MLCIPLKDCKEVLSNYSVLKTFSYFRMKFTPHFSVIFTPILTIQITSVSHPTLLAFPWFLLLST